MSYELSIHPDLDEEIREQALYYQDQFSTGINDFIDAIEDTYARIERFPYSSQEVEELNNKDIRAISVRAEVSRKNFAKNFPFKLIYKVYPSENRVVLYQLWPDKSNRRIDDLD